MTKHRNIWEYVRTDSSEYYRSVIQPEGFDHFLRATAAKLLWVSFWYILGTTFIPIEDTLVRNAAVLFIGGAVPLFWDKVVKDHAPKWCGDLLSGKVFFEVDIPALNRYILTLFAANAAALFAPDAWKHIKIHE